MGCRVRRRHIWDYSVCLCPIKGSPFLNELNSAIIFGTFCSSRCAIIVLEGYPRINKLTSLNGQRWNDQTTIVYDSFERYSGCRYFAIIDQDEFFIPGKYRTLGEMFVSMIEFSSLHVYLVPGNTRLLVKVFFKYYMIPKLMFIPGKCRTLVEIFVSII